MIWFVFLIAALAVLIAGQRLTRAGDRLAEETGISRGFVGVILLGFVTSLPEMVSTISATLFNGAPNLAMGNVFGSNACNLSILAFLELAIISRTSRPRLHLDDESRLTAYLSLVIMSLALMGLAARGYWHIFHLDLFSPVIALAYVIGLKKLHTFQNGCPADAGTDEKAESTGGLSPELRKSLLINAGVIVAASITLAYSAGRIAEITGWGTTFVGNSLLAVATSLPEIVVTFSAVRLGSFAMAAGNIFGSNIFNITILALADLVYFHGSLFAAAAPSQSLVAAIGLLMTGLYLFAGHYASEKRIFGRWPADALLQVAIYLFSLYALFTLR
jgi:cation:H+ antiporter